MKSVDQKKIGKLRKRHNHDLIKRMRDGEPLKGFDNQSSWFPPRPIVKKDQKAIAKLYRSRDGEGPVLSLEVDHDGDHNNTPPAPPAAS